MSLLTTDPAPRDPATLPIADYFWQRAADGSATAGPVPFQKFETACKHFARFLGRKPYVADLTTEQIDRLGHCIVSRGRRQTTANEATFQLARLGRAAFADGLLAAPPERQRIEPGAAPRRLALTVEEIERLLATCSREAGDVAGVPAAAWWSALVLTILNSDLSFAALMAVPRSALNLARGELRAGGLVYWLHPATAALLEHLPDAGERLFPWELDRDRPQFEMAFYHFRRLLKAAGIPHQPGACFERLRGASREGLALFDRISLERVDQLARQLAAAAEERERRAEERKRLRRAKAQAAVPAARRLPRKTRDVYPITSNSPRTLKRFFAEVYAPRRLPGCSPATLEQYANIINRFRAFAGCDVTIDGLAQRGLLEDFMGWIVTTGRSPRTANKARAHLRAIWNYARRREYVGGNPDYVDALRAPKREVRTWTMEEFERLLASASIIPGKFNGLPYRRLLPALLLCCYDTGLRIGALLQMRSEDFDDAGAALFCPYEISKVRADERRRLSAETVQQLRLLNPGSRKMLFAGPLREAGKRATRREVVLTWRIVTRRLKLALRQAGLKCGRRELWHNIRRLSATQVCAAGGRDLTISHLGHKGSNVVDSYLDLTQITRPDVTSMIPRPRLPAAGQRPALPQYRPGSEAEAEQLHKRN